MDAHPSPPPSPLLLSSPPSSRFTRALLPSPHSLPQDRREKESFFNWFYLAINVGSLIACTVIVYIQDQVSWTLGFAVPGAQATARPGPNPDLVRVLQKL